MSRFEISNICTWTKDGVGTKVLEPQRIIDFLADSVDEDAVKFDEHGHAFVPCPQLAGPSEGVVSCGVGQHTNIVLDYVLREYRGQVSAYLQRQYAATATNVAVILYTRNGYLSDPDVDATEAARIKGIEDCYYVVVCVLASAGPKAPVAPRRFCANLAGGNPEWAAFDKATLVKMAAETTTYHDTWCTVAD